jgi:glycosyltransferase involved in cell wall biosynthesis
MPYLTNYLRVWDRCAADRVDVFVGISEYVARRINKYYRRDAHVIYPPVNTAWLKSCEDYGDYYLVAGRLIPYKRTDIVVEAFNRLGLPLKIVGTGTELDYLRELAGPSIEFCGRVTDQELAELYSRCRALIFPPEEDFGIVPLEAMAAGRPVIAYRAGGALETVVEGETGVFFDRQDADALIEVIRDFDPGSFEPERAREQALKFDVKVFKKKIADFVDMTWREFQAEPGSPAKRGHLSSVSPLMTNTEGRNGSSTDKERAI